jgi:hypothetical protein
MKIEKSENTLRNNANQIGDITLYVFKKVKKTTLYEAKNELGVKTRREKNNFLIYNYYVIFFNFVVFFFLNILILKFNKKKVTCVKLEYFFIVSFVSFLFK